MQSGNQSSIPINDSSREVSQISGVKRVVKQIIAARDGTSNLMQTRVGLEFIPGLHMEFDEQSLKHLHDELDKIQEHLDGIHSDK